MKLLAHITMTNVWNTIKADWLKLKREWNEKINEAGALKIHYQNWDYIIKTRQTKLKTIQKIADFFGVDGKDLLT